MSKYLSADIKACTLFGYLVIIKSRASYSPVTWLATSQELVKTFEWLTSSCLASFRPAKRASYLAWLLVTLNANCRTYSATTPTMFSRISPTLLSREFKAPSTSRIQVVVGSGCSLRCLVGAFLSSLLGLVHSTRKLARAYAFINDIRQQKISNSLSLVIHFTIHLEVFSHCKMALSGCLVRTTIKCTWKQGLRSCTKIISVKTIFSGLEYLVSTLWSTRLVQYMDFQNPSSSIRTSTKLITFRDVVKYRYSISPTSDLESRVEKRGSSSNP